MTKNQRQNLNVVLICVAVGVGFVSLLYFSKTYQNPKFNRGNCVQITDVIGTPKKVIRIEYLTASGVFYNATQLLPEKMYLASFEDTRIVDATGNKVDCDIVNLINLGMSND